MNSTLKDFFSEERKRVFEPGPYFAQRVMAHVSDRAPVEIWEMIPRATRPVLGIALAVLIGFGGAAQAADSCATQAAAKKLHGAAEASFIKKCASDATANCEASAKAKSLHGAAETSFVKKCVRSPSTTRTGSVIVPSEPLRRFHLCRRGFSTSRN